MEIVLTMSIHLPLLFASVGLDDCLQTLVLYKRADA